MKKLYKRIDGVLHYHEAWSTGSGFEEHWGVVGERGQVKTHRSKRGVSEEEQIRRILETAAAGGYVPIDDSELHTICVLYQINNHGSKLDLQKRHALEERLNETLGWTGLGHCDGGSIGSGTMEVFCLVVDLDVARRVIEVDLAGTEFHDFAEISALDENTGDEDAP